VVAIERLPWGCLRDEQHDIRRACDQHVRRSLSYGRMRRRLSSVFGRRSRQWIPSTRAETILWARLDLCDVERGKFDFSMLPVTTVDRTCFN